VRRLAERAIALVALGVVAPALLLCAAAIRRTSPGPAFFRARRVGLGGREFVMFKLRTMHCTMKTDRRISSANDPRVVSRFAGWLRRAKVDELPQLLNVVRGEMAFVGPRPEDPDIVRACYSREQLETLRVLPGLTSPGSLYSSTHGEQMLPAVDTERHYIERVLPVTLALDLFYVRHASLAYDIGVVTRTLHLVVSKACGREWSEEPPELRQALASSGSFRRAPSTRSGAAPPSHGRQRAS
jgi:lipopolysaccharide/colanic/teichoic acid biosynthesis glycosyltransferase